MSSEQHRIDLAVLKTVRMLCDGASRRLTFGQIYMHLIRLSPTVPPIVHCVETVDTLVREGLLHSVRVLDEDPDFPYTQHIISGLTEIGEASLMGCAEHALAG